MRGDKSLKLDLTLQETPTAMDDLSSTAVRCIMSHKGCRAKGTQASALDEPAYVLYMELHTDDMRAAKYVPKRLALPLSFHRYATDVSSSPKDHQ